MSKGSNSWQHMQQKKREEEYYWQQQEQQREEEEAPYGGHPIQRQYPQYQYGTREIRHSERSEVAQHSQANEYLKKHRLVEKVSEWLD